MRACEFCHIIAGDSPAHRLYDDDRAMAFLDRNPAVDGHTLVVPTVHREGLLTANGPTTDAVFRAVRTVAAAIDEALDPDGFSVFHTSADLVGDVAHPHVHLVPRTAADDIHVALSRQPLVDAAAAPLAARIRAQL